MELEVFDLSLNNLGIIDVFIECKIEIFYDKLSKLTLSIDASDKNIKLLKIGNILTKDDDLKRGYIIEHFNYTDDSGEKIEIIANSLNKLLNDRIVFRQQRYYGNVEDVIKSFVAANAINPADSNRIIPNLILASNSGIDVTTDETATGNQLGDYCYELTNKNEMSWDVFINLDIKKFEFTTWKGINRSTEQSIEKAITFSKELDNILKQDFIEDSQDFKTTAIVAGEGEGIDRKYVLVNNGLAGYDRKEIFVDARDLQSSYTDDNGDEITMSSTEYIDTLTKRGESELMEYLKIKTFVPEIDIYSKFKYGVDFFVGDIVTIEEEKLNIALHTRVMGVTEVYNKSGITITPSFGNNIPSLLDRMKKVVKS